MRPTVEHKYAAPHVSDRFYHKIALPTYYGVTLISGISDGGYHFYDLIIRLPVFPSYTNILETMVIESTTATLKNLFTVNAALKEVVLLLKVYPDISKYLSMSFGQESKQIHAEDNYYDLSSIGPVFGCCYSFVAIKNWKCFT